MKSTIKKPKSHYRVSDLFKKSSDNNNFDSMEEDSFGDEAEIPGEINYFNPDIFEKQLRYSDISAKPSSVMNSNVDIFFGKKSNIEFSR